MAVAALREKHTCREMAERILNRQIHAMTWTAGDVNVNTHQGKSAVFESDRRRLKLLCLSLQIFSKQ
jgi:hypothetical protein